MPADDRPPIRRISVDELKDVLREKSVPDDPDAERSWSTAMQLLGLLPADQSAQEALIEGGVERIAAYYDAEEKLVSVVDRGERGDPGRDLFVLAHELSHALRDAESDLLAFRERYAKSSDGVAATSSLIEGEAMVVGAAVVARASQGADYVVDWDELEANLDEATLETIESSPAPFIAAVEQLPYAYGMRRLGRPWDSRGRAAVDALYEHPLLTLAGWRGQRDDQAEPDPLECFPTAGPPGYAGYDSDSLGIAALIGLPVALGTTNASSAVDISDGWRDDRLVIFRADGDPAGADHAVAWRLRFDSAEHARKFGDTIGCCLPGNAQRSQHDRELLILAASSDEALAAWSDAAACGRAQDVPVVTSGDADMRPATLLNPAQIPMAFGPRGR